MEGSGAPNMPKLALKRLMGEFKIIQKAITGEAASWLSRCEPSDPDNLTSWDADIRFPEDSLLQQSLNELSRSIFEESRNFLTLQIRFPIEYPLSPPEVWVRHPRLKYKSAPVTFGGKVCNALLTSQGWVPSSSSLNVLTLVREALAEAGAEVDIRVSVKRKTPLSLPPALNRLATHLIPQSGDFRKEGLKVISAVLASPMVGDVSRLEVSDKIMLPFEYAEEVYGNDAYRTNTFFEVKTQLGRKTHCALMDFVHGLPKDFALLPKWLMEDLLIEEQEPVMIRTVSLDLATFIKIQPHGVDFYEAVDKSGVDAKILLRESLRRYSALTEDTSVPIQIGSESYNVQIVELKPKAAVAIISAGEFEIPVDFDPAPDLEDESERKAREQELIARYKAQRDKHAAGQESRKQRCEAAKRANFQRIRDKACASAGADNGSDGEVEIALRLPSGKQLKGIFREGAPVSALAALALTSEWAEGCCPWGVQLVTSYPRRFLKETDTITNAMHRSCIGVLEDKEPEHDEQITFLESGEEGAGLLQEATDQTQPLPDLDEQSVQRRTQRAFEIQRFIQAGYDLAEAAKRVDAGEELPPTGTGMQTSRPAIPSVHAAAPVPPAPRTEPTDENAAKVQQVINFTAVPREIAIDFLERHNWNAQNAANAILDQH